MALMITQTVLLLLLVVMFAFFWFWFSADINNVRQEYYQVQSDVSKMRKVFSDTRMGERMFGALEKLETAVIKSDALDDAQTLMKLAKNMLQYIKDMELMTHLHRLIVNFEHFLGPFHNTVATPETAEP